LSNRFTLTKLSWGDWHREGTISKLPVCAKYGKIDRSRTMQMSPLSEWSTDNPYVNEHRHVNERPGLNWSLWLSPTAKHIKKILARTPFLLLAAWWVSLRLKTRTGLSDFSINQSIKIYVAPHVCIGPDEVMDLLSLTWFVNIDDSLLLVISSMPFTCGIACSYFGGVARQF